MNIDKIKELNKFLKKELDIKTPLFIENLDKIKSILVSGDAKYNKQALKELFDSVDVCLTIFTEYYEMHQILDENLNDENSPLYTDLKIKEELEDVKKQNALLHSILRKRTS